MSGRKIELSGCVARRQHADDQPAPLDEPARRDGRAEHQRNEAGADADDDAPQRDELPHLGHRQRGENAERDHRHRRVTTGRTPKRLMKAAANGAIRPKSSDAQGKRRGDVGGAPAEFLLERLR